VKIVVLVNCVPPPKGSVNHPANEKPVLVGEVSEPTAALNGQLNDCLAFARQHDYEVVATYIDA